MFRVAPLLILLLHGTCYGGWSCLKRALLFFKPEPTSRQAPPQAAAEVLHESDIIEDTDSKIRNRLPNPRPYFHRRPRTASAGPPWWRATIVEEADGSVTIAPASQSLPRFVGGTEIRFPEVNVGRIRLPSNFVREENMIGHGGTRNVYVLPGTENNRPRLFIKILRDDISNELAATFISRELGLTSALATRGRALNTGLVTTREHFAKLPADTRYMLAQRGIHNFTDYRTAVRNQNIPMLGNRGYRVARNIDSQASFVNLPQSARDALAAAGVHNYGDLQTSRAIISDEIIGTPVGEWIETHPFSSVTAQTYHNIYNLVRDIDLIDRHVYQGMSERFGSWFFMAHPEHIPGNIRGTGIFRPESTTRHIGARLHGIDMGPTNLSQTAADAFNNILVEEGSGDLVFIDN